MQSGAQRTEGVVVGIFVAAGMWCSRCGNKMKLGRIYYNALSVGVSGAGHEGPLRGFSVKRTDVLTFSNEFPLKCVPSVTLMTLLSPCVLTCTV